MAPPAPTEHSAPTGAHAWSATAATDPWAAVARTADAVVRTADADRAPRACLAALAAAAGFAPAATGVDADHRAFRASLGVAANTAAAFVRPRRDDPQLCRALCQASPALRWSQAAATADGRCAAARPGDVWRASAGAQAAEPSPVLQCADEWLAARIAPRAETQALVLARRPLPELEARVPQPGPVPQAAPQPAVAPRRPPAQRRRVERARAPAPAAAVRRQELAVR